jgi:hypothetical protein
VFAHDGADAVGPTALRFQICFDLHDSVLSRWKTIIVNDEFLHRQVQPC